MAIECFRIDFAESEFGHPWVPIAALAELPPHLENGAVIGLSDGSGRSLGCGILDRNDPLAAWRRFSLAESTPFDEDFVGNALVESIHRRAEETCLRLVASDADYLPGLTADYYDGVIDLSCASPAIEAHLAMILEILQEQIQPAEIVIWKNGEVFTKSGQNLRARWVEIDLISHRIDLLHPSKGRVFLDQREQHALVGSLCEGRSVLDAFSHAGAFGLHAAKAGARRVVAVDCEKDLVKGIGAAAQKNDCGIETVAGDASAYLEGAAPGEFDCMVFDPPGSAFLDADAILRLHRHAFARLPQGGVLASYCRDVATSEGAFEEMVSRAAALEGREGRIFAHTTQPFDFPTLLRFPESRVLKGLIVQVE